MCVGNLSVNCCVRYLSPICVTTGAYMTRHSEFSLIDQCRLQSIFQMEDNVMSLQVHKQSIYCLDDALRDFIVGAY